MIGVTVIPSAVPFQEFTKHLNVTTKTSVDDEEMETTLRAATGAAEGLIGPIIIRQFTAYLAGRGHLALPKRPVVSVESLTHPFGYAGPYSGAALDVDPNSGVVGLAYGGHLMDGRWTVVYTAGRAESPDLVPEDIRLAVCIIGKHLWETQRGGTSRPGMLGRTSSVDPAERVPMGFALPNRAVALLAPYWQPGAI